MSLIYFILGISLTFNIITIIGLIVIYKKFMRDNPLSFLYQKPKKKDDDIISKLKNKKDMEFWDL